MSEIQNGFPLFLKALELAAERHKNQRRKGSDNLPYINHPIRVAAILQQAGNVDDWNVLIAAILHDTVEDTQTTEDELKMIFGEKIASIVMECTDDKNLKTERRKELQVLTASHKSKEAKLVKLADKINNVNDILVCPPQNWTNKRKQEYLLWAEAVVLGLKGENSALDKMFYELLERGKKELAEV